MAIMPGAKIFDLSVYQIKLLTHFIMKCNLNCRLILTFSSTTVNTAKYNELYCSILTAIRYSKKSLNILFTVNIKYLVENDRLCVSFNFQLDHLTVDTLIV